MAQDIPLPPGSTSYPNRIYRLNRRELLALPILASIPAVHSASAQTEPSQFQFPIAWPGAIPGNGFWIRHGYACENTWYNPGYWHTGEDWYAIDAEAAGAEVLAISAGEVVFAGSDYPGRVVIVRHEPDLYSMYGHLDYTLDVTEGSAIATGQRLGTVLLRTDGAAPSHLHFEVRTFLTTPEVNGDRPRYGFACGLNCAPGPGYWPIDAPEHPSALGWRNPSHVIGQRMLVHAQSVVVADGVEEAVPVLSLPDDRRGSTQIGHRPLQAGERYPLLGIAGGAETSERSSADAYRLWYRIALPDQEDGWVQAAVPSSRETGSDDRSSAIAWRLFPTANEPEEAIGTLVR